MRQNNPRFLLLTLLLFTFIGGCSPSARQPPALYRAEAYFSPGGGVRARIIRSIDESNKSIDVAVFNLTSRDIKSALQSAKNRGVEIRIITDSEQAKGTHSAARALMNERFNIKLARGKDKGAMHDKFAIFDGRLLVTGSYNWTETAERFNYENAVFISDPEIIRKYQKEFDRIWNFS